MTLLDPAQNWSFNVSYVDGEMFDIAGLHYWQFTNGWAWQDQGCSASC